MWVNTYLEDVLIREQIAHGRSHTMAGTQADLPREFRDIRPPVAPEPGVARRRLLLGLGAAGALVAATLLGIASGAGSGEIKVLSAAAMQSVFKEIAGDFERTSGHRLVIT